MVLTKSAIFFLSDTLKVTGFTISTPKSYDEHPRQVKFAPPGPHLQYLRNVISNIMTPMIKIRGRIVSFKPLNLFHHELKNDRLIGQITIVSKKEVTPLLLRVEMIKIVYLK